MTRIAAGTFDVTVTPLNAIDGALSALSLHKTFAGELQGTSVGQMLAARTAIAGSAGYVAMERVTGTLDGRQGSFVLQHSGTMQGGSQSATVAVVPDSATGGLDGLTGTMDIAQVDGKHHYTFHYGLPDR